MLRYTEAIADMIYNRQSLLLSLWQFFGQHIAKKNWKILNLPQHFVAHVLLTTVAVPKQGELPYYRLQITYSDWFFSVRISSICWFKHFISSRWDCLIIMNIIAEGEPLLKIRGRRLLNYLLIKKFILYKYFTFKFRIWITDLSESLWTENS